MKVAEVGTFDELFTHVGDTDGKQTVYNVTKLFDYISTHELEVQRVVTPVDKEHATYCIERRGVEQDRLDALVQNVEYLKKPIMFVAQPNGSHVLVDGTHRYIIYWWAKAVNIPAYIVPWSVAEPFVIEDMPEANEADLMAAWSGMSLLRQLQGQKS